MSRHSKLATTALAVALSCAGCAPVVVAGAAAVGVTSQQERSTAAALSDADINARLDAALIREPDQVFVGLSTHVQEGRVTLMGTLNREEQSARAEQIARETPGVLSVKNVIETGGVRSRGQILQDVRIANTARLRLLALEDVPSINYSITVINGTVHINGLAQSEDELRRVVEEMSRLGGAARVVSHVLLVDDPIRTGS